MTTTNLGSDPSEGAGVYEPRVPDAVSANAPDGREITASCGCDAVCEGLHDLRRAPQRWPPQDGAVAGPPQQPQRMLPGLEGC